MDSVERSRRRFLQFVVAAALSIRGSGRSNALAREIAPVLRAEDAVNVFESTTLSAHRSGSSCTRVRIGQSPGGFWQEPNEPVVRSWHSRLICRRVKEKGSGAFAATRTRTAATATNPGLSIM